MLEKERKKKNIQPALCCCSHADVRRLRGRTAPQLPLSPRGLVGDEWKMSVSGLKAELKFLESIFDPNHERFRIIDWKPDELSCQFNVTGEKLLIIHCNITVRAAGRVAHIS